MWEYTTQTFNSVFDTEKSLKKKVIKCLNNMGKKVGNLLTFNV